MGAPPQFFLLTGWRHLGDVGWSWAPFGAAVVEELGVRPMKDSVMYVRECGAGRRW